MAIDLRKDKDKPRKERKKTTIQLKKELDAIFSKYIRQKYSKDGFGQCFTCSKRLAISDLQCGHFVSRIYLGTRYAEDNCRPQCIGCNVFGGGKTAQFAANLERIYGPKIISDLFRQANNIVKNFPYKEKIEEFKEKIKQLDDKS